MRAGDLVYVWSDQGRAMTYSDPNMLVRSALGFVPVCVPVFLVKQIRENCWAVLINGQSAFIYPSNLSMAPDARRRHMPLRNL